MTKKTYYMMGMGRYYAMRRKMEKEVRNGLNGEAETSPVKTMLGSLNVNNKNYNQVTTKIHNNKLDPAAPKSIEEVPFRRQDRRILNARNRRIIDRKLIIFIVSVGLLLMGIGAGFTVLYILYHEDYSAVKPFSILGPVLAGCGLVTMLCSIEICVRLCKSLRRVKDPELDNLVNPHEVKHWMDPNIIPFGWGLYNEAHEVMTIDIAGSNKQLSVGRGVSGSVVSVTDIENQVDAADREDSLAGSPHRYGNTVNPGPRVSSE